MTCPQLWQPSHSEAHRGLADLVVRLRDQSSFDFARIANELNTAGLVSPRGKSFYAALVYSIYRKWTARLQRERRRVVVTLKDVSVAPVDDAMSSQRIG